MTIIEIAGDKKMAQCNNDIENIIKDIVINYQGHLSTLKVYEGLGTHQQELCDYLCMEAKTTASKEDFEAECYLIEEQCSELGEREAKLNLEYSLLPSNRLHACDAYINKYCSDHVNDPGNTDYHVLQAMESFLKD